MNAFLLPASLNKKSSLLHQVTHISPGGIKGKLSRLSSFDIFTVGLTTFFICLGIAQYVSNRNLWGDEAAIARSIITRNFWQLLQPLDHDQLAPLLFLEMEELFTNLIWSFEYGIRFFPLLCFIGMFIGYVKVCRVIFKNPILALLAICLVGWNYRIVYYSVEIKQYMSETLVTVWLLYLLLRPYSSESRKTKILAITGVIAVFLSSIAPILLLAAGFYLLADYYLGKKESFEVLLKASPWWIRAFAVNYFTIFFRNTNSRIQIAYWNNYQGFMPTDSVGSTIEFLSLKLNEVADDFVQFPIFGEPLFFLLIVAGGVALAFSRKWNLLVFCGLPLLIHLLLSALHAYPVTPRLLLYLYPLLAILVTFGVGAIFSVIQKLGEKIKGNSLSVPYQKLWWTAPAVVFVTYVNSWCFSKPMIVKQSEVKECLQSIIDKRMVDDKVYSFPNNNEIVSYYSDINFKQNHLPIKYGTPLAGKPDENTTSLILEEMKSQRTKTWLIFTGIGRDSARYYVDHLQSEGFEMLDSISTYNVDSYLLDFSPGVN